MPDCAAVSARLSPCDLEVRRGSAAAAPDVYPEGELAEGMVLTVEPGLYFQQDDLLVPEELRGIGIRIEDDVVVTSDGALNLSGSLPRDPDAIEEWMGALRR